MKRYITILLLLIIFLQTFSRFVIEADYFLNRSYIAKVLCVNREKPKMHCNGKCYLAKQLEEEQKQQQAPVAKKLKLDIPLFDITKPLQLNIQIKGNKQEYVFAGVPQLSSFDRSIFHPPSV